jgi:hypothetical protein
MCSGRHGTGLADTGMVNRSKEMVMETSAVQKHITTPPPGTDEEQRKACFDLFNAYWADAVNKGIPFDTVGTMSIAAALFALVAKHGPETTAEFVQDLAKSVLQDEFSATKRPN